MAKRGDAMIEFFALLPTMREMYEKKGIVVAKRMYEILKSEGKISMSLSQFGKHFARNLAPKKEPVIVAGSTPKNADSAAVISAADHAPVKSIEETREEETSGILLRDKPVSKMNNPEIGHAHIPKKL